MEHEFIKVTESERNKILTAVKQYVDTIVKHKDMKDKFIEKMEDEEFKNLLVNGFVDINFVSVSVVLSIKKQNNNHANAYNAVVNKSKNDPFEVKELKMYLINNLIDENTPQWIIDSSLNLLQLKNYRKIMSDFKKEYLKIFE